MKTSKKLFLSAVTCEFAPHRTLLSKYLDRPNLDVAVQERFLGTGGTTLDKVDQYIQHCDAVIHIIGKARGAVPEGEAVGTLLRRHSDFAQRVPSIAEHLVNSQPSFSYTQWEAYLALYHGRPLYIYLPNDFRDESVHVGRDPRFVFDATEARCQREHHKRLCAMGRDRSEFPDAKDLTCSVLRDLVEILPRLEVNLEESPLLPFAYFKRPSYVVQLASGCYSGDYPRLRIVRGESGSGKSSLAAEFYADARKGLSGGDTSIWIDCRAHFAPPHQLLNAAERSKLRIVALDNLTDGHPAITEHWCKYLRDTFVLVTTTSSKVANLLIADAGKHDEPQTIINLEPFSLDERMGFFRDHAPTRCVEALGQCCELVGSSLIALQFLVELANNDPDRTCEYAGKLDLKDLVEEWAAIADENGTISTVIDCLAAVPFIGMDQDALQRVLEIPPTRLQPALDRLRSLGVVTPISAATVGKNGSILLLHERLRQLFSGNALQREKHWKARYRTLLKERLREKSSLGVLTCVDAWLAGWEEVFDPASTAPREEKYAHQEETLRTLLDAENQSWTAALQAVPDVLASHSQDPSKENCALLIGMAQMVSRLPGHRALATTIWCGCKNPNLWARSASIAAAVRQWADLGGVHVKRAIPELKLWLSLAEQMHESERYNSADSQFWSDGMDSDYLAVVCGILKLEGFNAALSIVRSASFKRRFPHLTLSELAIMVHYADSGALSGSDETTKARIQTLQDWSKTLSKDQYGCMLAAGIIGRYIYDHTGVALPELLQCNGSPTETPALDVAHLGGSDRLYEYICARIPGARWHY